MLVCNYFMFLLWFCEVLLFYILNKKQSLEENSIVKLRIFKTEGIGM